MIESFLFLFTGIIGAVTIALMITSYRTNPFYNIYLLLIITIISFRFLTHGSYELGMQTIFKADKGPFSVFYLVIAPCFYLYHKNLAFQNKTFNPKDTKHLIFIICLFIINTNSFIKQNYMVNYGKITNFILIITFLLFYITLVFNLLRRNIWFKKDLLINDKHFKLVKNWTVYLFSINALAVLIIIASVYTEVNKDIYLSGKSLATFSLLFWLFIYFKILATPEILYGLPILNKKILKFGLPALETETKLASKSNTWILETTNTKNEQDTKLQEKIAANIISYTDEVDKLSNEHFIFRNPKASPNDIANALGVPTSHIVYLFKYHSTIPFSEYRMYCRIQDSINLIEAGYLKTNTLESLAYKTGFASYNPFFSAFKKVTGNSPQDYLKTKNLNFSN